MFENDISRNYSQNELGDLRVIFEGSGVQMMPAETKQSWYFSSSLFAVDKK